MSSQTPDWAKNLADAIGEFARGMEQVGHIAIAQGAMGWIYQGDMESAQREVAKLPPEQLSALSIAAATLSSLADEEAARRG